MKTRLVMLIFFFCATISRATECVDRTFTFAHLDFVLCQNYSNYNETTVLLYKARARQLNRFIADLIDKGQLKDKKVTIGIKDPALTYDYINVSQSDYSYDIDCSGFLTVEALARTIVYFTQADWTSYVYDPGKVKDPGAIRKRFVDLVNKVPLPDLSSYISDSDPLWQLDSFSLRYSNDAIHYYNDGQLLPFKPTSNLPVKIHDRYLFFQQDSIFVVQNGSTIKFFKIPEGEEQDYSVVTSDKWVNIGFGAEHILYSYSYDRNRFYDLRKEN